MSQKRPRSSTPSPSASSPPSSSKFLRASPETPDIHLSCTLPPTCSHPHPPSHLASTRDLEAHYATYHSHVCEADACGCVFPDPRLLELHFSECHDPITALQKDRGEKTFACHLAACPRRFLTPKARRLHLIHAHGFPKAYFFAVTNKGVGGLLSRWGQGASLVRGEWRARDQDMRADGDGDSDGDPDDARHPPHGADGMRDAPADDAAPGPSRLPARPRAGAGAGLADAMSSLSLVPSKIRFGRGGKKGGFAPPPAPEPCRNGKAGQPRRRGGRRGAQAKTRGGADGAGGDVAMQG